MRYLFLIFLSLNVHAWTVVPANNSRALNTNYLLSSSVDTWVSYSVTSTCTATLIGGQTETIELRSDTATTPTTVRATYTNGNTVSLAIAITVTNTQASQLSYLVPRGHSIRINSTGTCTAVSIVSQVELPVKSEFDGVDFTTGFPFK